MARTSLALYEEGLRLVDIAAATAGVWRCRSGRLWCDIPQERVPRRRVLRRPAAPPIGAEESSRMTTLYEEWLPIRRIALATGRSRGGVRRVLRRWGL